MKENKKTRESFYHKGYIVEKRNKDWYSYLFKGTFSTIKEFKSYIDGRIGRGNLEDRSNVS